MTTGAICSVPGFYKSMCCRAVVTLAMGERKPSCPRCDKPAIWEWTKPLPPTAGKARSVRGKIDGRKPK